MRTSVPVGETYNAYAHTIIGANNFSVTFSAKSVSANVNAGSGKRRFPDKIST
jgi:hypothetical protein